MQQANRLFFALWLFIIFVSVVDGYLVVEHRRLIMENELNPIGRLLLHLSGGHVWLLLTAKFLGTVSACGALLVIHRRFHRTGTAIAAALAAFQFCLLLFLTLS